MLAEDAASQQHVKLSVLYSNFVNDPNIANEVIPDDKQISRQRCKMNAKIAQDIPGDSVEELTLLVRNELVILNPEPTQLWADWNFTKLEENVTIIPITSDKMLRDFGKFIMKGISVFQIEKFLKFGWFYFLIFLLLVGLLLVVDLVDGLADFEDWVLLWMVMSCRRLHPYRCWW